jgi:hypothetical protein
MQTTKWTRWSKWGGTTVLNVDEATDPRGDGRTVVSVHRTRAWIKSDPFVWSVARMVRAPEKPLGWKLANVFEGEADTLPAARKAAEAAMRESIADEMLSTNAASRKNGGVAFWSDEALVQAFENEGATTSDAQAAVEGAKHPLRGSWGSGSVLDVEARRNALLDRIAGMPDGSKREELQDEIDALGEARYRTEEEEKAIARVELRGGKDERSAPIQTIREEDPWKGGELASRIRSAQDRLVEPKCDCAPEDGDFGSGFHFETCEKAPAQAAEMRRQGIREELPRYDDETDAEYADRSGKNDDDYLDGFRLGAGQESGTLEELRSEWYYRGYEAGVDHRAEEAKRDAADARMRAREEKELQEAEAREEEILRTARQMDVSPDDAARIRRSDRSLSKAVDRAVAQENAAFLDDPDAQAEAARVGDLWRLALEAEAAELEYARTGLTIDAQKAVTAREAAVAAGWKGSVVQEGSEWAKALEAESKIRGSAADGTLHVATDEELENESIGEELPRYPLLARIASGEQEKIDAEIDRFDRRNEPRGDDRRSTGRPFVPEWKRRELEKLERGEAAGKDLGIAEEVPSYDDEDPLRKTTLEHYALEHAGVPLGCLECAEMAQERVQAALQAAPKARAEKTLREIRNPVLGLPAVAAIEELDPQARKVLGALLRELGKDATSRAEESWTKGKGPMAAYWKAVGIYARHIARVVEPR